MFGTIGHIRIKAGHEADLTKLMDDWVVTIRPQIPGSFVNFFGRSVDRSGESVFVALAQDQATYRRLADMPEQDAWYRQLLEHIEQEPTWEDVELEQSPA